MAEGNQQLLAMEAQLKAMQKQMDQFKKSNSEPKENISKPKNQIGCNKGDKCKNLHLEDEKTNPSKMSLEATVKTQSTSTAKICWNFGSPKGCKNGDKCKFVHTPKAGKNLRSEDEKTNSPKMSLEATVKTQTTNTAKICCYFGSPKGCKNGDKCKNLHSDDQKTNASKMSLEATVKTQSTTRTAKICWNFGSPKGCKNGDKCKFVHTPKAGKDAHTPKAGKDEEKSSIKNMQRSKSYHAPHKKSKLKSCDSPNCPWEQRAPPPLHNVDICMKLEALSNGWYHNKDINVKNLGVYLKGVTDGYKVNFDRQLNYGYVKYGSFCRIFCEVYCNYLLKGTADKSMLKMKMDALKKKVRGFPYKEMNYIRKNTNTFVHGVYFNIDATKRFLPVETQKELLLKIYTIASWLKLYDEDTSKGTAS